MTSGGAALDAKAFEARVDSLLQEKLAQLGHLFSNAADARLYVIVEGG